MGRGEELAFLERAIGSGAGGVVIAGETGVGKSRLAADFVDGYSDRPIVRVAASASLRGVPLGAFAATLPPGLSRTPRQPAEALRLVADHLVSLAAAPPLVWVDDAQLLDELSAGLVLQLAVGRRAFLVVTLRIGDECPDAVRRLWRDGHAQRLEIQPLGPADTGELLAGALGGPVDGGTRQRMWNASRGNLLYLRELVRVGVESGALALHGERWIWTGALRVSAALQELIAERLTGLDAASYAALEAIAFAEPVAGPVAEDLGIVPRLAALERAGLVQRDADAIVRLSHPLFGQVLRASVGPLRAAELERAHAAALANTGADLLRLAIAQADGVVAADPAVLLEATVRARALADPELSTRLARAALEADGGAPAVIALAECLFWEQRHADVLALIDEGQLARLDPPARALALLHRASSLYWGFGREAEAVADLCRAEELGRGDGRGEEAAGQRSMLLSNAARPLEAIETARRILDAPRSCDRARVYAFSGITIGLAVAGRFDEALAAAVRGAPLALQMRDEMPATGGGILIGSCIAWFLTGQFGALEQIVGGLYQRSAEIGDPFLGVWAHFLARNDLMRGRLADADRRASESVALLRLHDPGLVLPWALAVLAQAAAQRGDAARARATVRELDRQPCRMASCDADLEIARAWVEATTGDLAGARRRTARVARGLCDAGLRGLGAFAIHELARLGDPAGADALLPEVEGRVDGALAAAWALHVRALAASDAALLEAAGDALFSVGSLLDAAECFASAATLHRDAGRRDAARRAAARVLEVAQRCDEARTPALAALRTDVTSALSPRELHIARLAASGATRRAIAEDLGLALRTVGNHLNHIYAKLEVSDRASLAALLAKSPDPAREDPAGQAD